MVGDTIETARPEAEADRFTHPDAGGGDAVLGVVGERAVRRPPTQKGEDAESMSSHCVDSSYASTDRAQG